MYQLHLFNNGFGQVATVFDMNNGMLETFFIDGANGKVTNDPKNTSWVSVKQQEASEEKEQEQAQNSTFVLVRSENSAGPTGNFYSVTTQDEFEKLVAEVKNFELEVTSKLNKIIEIVKEKTKNG